MILHERPWSTHTIERESSTQDILNEPLGKCQTLRVANPEQIAKLGSRDRQGLRGRILNPAYVIVCTRRRGSPKQSTTNPILSFQPTHYSSSLSLYDAHLHTRYANTLPFNLADYRHSMQRKRARSESSAHPTPRLLSDGVTFLSTLAARVAERQFTTHTREPLAFRNPNSPIHHVWVSYVIPKSIESRQPQQTGSLQNHGRQGPCASA